MTDETAIKNIDECVFKVLLLMDAIEKLRAHDKLMNDVWWKVGNGCGELILAKAMLMDRINRERVRTDTDQQV